MRQRRGGDLLFLFRVLGDTAEKTVSGVRSCKIGPAMDPLHEGLLGQRFDGPANCFLGNLQNFRKLRATRRPSQAAQGLQQFQLSMR
jgi:hypothetical protein